MSWQKERAGFESVSRDWALVRLPNWVSFSPDGSSCPKNSGTQSAKGSFPPSRTFWMFLSQVLSQDASCREVLREFLAWIAVEEGKVASPNTAGYCKARAKLDLKNIEDVNRRVIRDMRAKESDEDLWHGRRVKVIDGSGISMPDTPVNQQAWPQSKRAKIGCSFPVMRIVAVFSLATGALMALAKDCLAVHERTLFRRLWDVFEPGDVALADRGFCSYADFYCLLKRGVDCVMRNNQSRTVGITCVKKLNKNDRIIEWIKTSVCPKWLNYEEWRAIPDRITVREITVHVDVPGFRTEKIVIVTTLLDSNIYTAEDFANLYLRRWRAELYLRDIKTTMGMDILKCKTSQMVVKELWMHVVAYNLMRALMQEATKTHNVPHDRISFKGTVSTVRTWANTLARPCLNFKKRRKLYELMLSYIAMDTIPFRPNRSEPRARKRRPKNYQLLNKSRHTFNEIKHRNRYKLP